MLYQHRWWRSLCYHFIQARQLEKLLPSVLPQFCQGIFAKDKAGSEEVKECWLEEVKKATTVPRLHLLLGILDSTVIWDLSAENAVSQHSFSKILMSKQWSFSKAGTLGTSFSRAPSYREVSGPAEFQLTMSALRPTLLSIYQYDIKLSQLPEPEVGYHFVFQQWQSLHMFSIFGVVLGMLA